jgi:hypothetical protein
MLPDGTRLGAGDAGAGGVLKVSKQGGEHLLLDGTITAHGRSLDFNDVGFMDRQNYLRGGAYAEFRTLKPGFGTTETHTSVLAYGMNNLDGLALDRGVLLSASAVLESRWTLTLGAHAQARRFDDREVGDGTALERSALWGLSQVLWTDPRKPLFVSARAVEERMSVGDNLTFEVGATWHPISTMELQVLPSYTRNFGEPRYAGTGASDEELVFGRLHAESVGVTTRASYTFTPTLSLQAYGQVFLARARYFDFSHFTSAGTGPRPDVSLGDLEPGGPPPLRPDFDRASLAVNVVLRWEYHLGSTVYLVYARSQNAGSGFDPTQAPRLDPLVLRTAPTTDLFLLKVVYWFG